MDRFPFNAAGFERENLSARLICAPSSLPAMGGKALRLAAVLIPIIARPAPAMLFTRRSETLSLHPGQVSFPGGSVHASDTSLVATALRETEEETGIAPDFVSVQGVLDVHETGTGYAILPVVGIVREGFTLTLDAGEVAGVFEVPLGFLLDPANLGEETREVAGSLRRIYAIRYQTHEIWGATAAMVVDFAKRMTAP